VRLKFLLERLHNVLQALLRGSYGLTLQLLRLRFITVQAGLLLVYMGLITLLLLVAVAVGQVQTQLAVAVLVVCFKALIIRLLPGQRTQSQWVLAVLLVQTALVLRVAIQVLLR
jgi:hypothetical protein